MPMWSWMIPASAAGPFLPMCQLTDDPLDGLAHRYLKEIKCPRTFRESNIDGATIGYKADLEGRFGYLGRVCQRMER